MIITLNEAEIRLAAFVGKKRHLCSRANGIVDRQFGDQDKFQIDIDGCMGEIALCKHLNIYPDLDAKPVGQATDRGDCEYRGLAIDVKTTRYKTGRLPCALWKNNMVDVYVLMIADGSPSLRCAGWAYAAELKRQENIKDLGRGELYIMEQNQLTDIQYLI